jgi:hypothetical protein
MIACIPTKNRLSTKTYKLFESVGIKAYHFIEPQEINEYDVPNKISIEANGQGIAYVRNFILDWARGKTDWIIMCDDDVSEFGIAIGNKCITKDASIFFDIHKKVSSLPFEMVGINYRQHAWHEKKQYNINKKFVEVCVMINVNKVKWSYRKEFNLKEDRDYVIQAMKYGNGTIKFNKYYFNCPGIGLNPGGLHNEYKLKKDEEAALRIAKEWHPYVELKRKEERIDIKFDFERFANDYKKIYK